MSYDRFTRIWKHKSTHLKDLIIRNINDKIRTISTLKGAISTLGLILEIEQKNTEEAQSNENWIRVMQEELQQFHINEVWELVPRPQDHLVIGKLNDQGKITRNKAKLVTKSYLQEE